MALAIWVDYWVRRVVDVVLYNNFLRSVQLVCSPIDQDLTTGESEQKQTRVATGSDDVNN